MGILKPHVQKRALFMFCVMFPILFILEFTGNSSLVATALVAGIAGGVSSVLFPDPEQKKLNEPKK